MHSNIFEDIKSDLERFTMLAQLWEILHEGSTQRNEGANNASNATAPKTRAYSSSSSLQDHVHTMIGLHNLRHQ
eukprot:10539348-Ditylum_brightwellii.AAC.1